MLPLKTIHSFKTIHQETIHNKIWGSIKNWKIWPHWSTFLSGNNWLDLRTYCLFWTITKSIGTMVSNMPYYVMMLCIYLRTFAHPGQYSWNTLRGLLISLPALFMTQLKCHPLIKAFPGLYLK